MCSSLQEREAGVRALQLFSGDNWFWNRPEMRAGRRGWLRTAAGSEPISAGLVPLITAALERRTRRLSRPGKLKPLSRPSCCRCLPITQRPDEFFMPRPLCLTGLPLWLEALLPVPFPSPSWSHPADSLGEKAARTQISSENFYLFCSSVELSSFAHNFTVFGFLTFIGATSGGLQMSRRDSFRVEQWFWMSVEESLFCLVISRYGRSEPLEQCSATYTMSTFWTTHLFTSG